MGKLSKFLCGVIVLLAVAAAFYITFNSATKMSKRYDIVVFGDSNIGNDNGGKGVVEILGQMTDSKVLNAGIGGTMLTRPKRDKYDATPWEYYSMVDLSVSFVNKDFGLQLASIPSPYLEFRKDSIGYVDETIRKMSECDLTKVRYIVIEQGLNDFLEGIPLYNSEDILDEESVSGALRKIFLNFEKAAPNATVILVSPAYNNVKGDCFTKSYGSGTLNDFVAMEKELAAEYKAVFIDLAHDTPINKINYREYMTDDKMHWNEKAANVVAQKIFEVMK